MKFLSSITTIFTALSTVQASLDTESPTLEARHYKKPSYHKPPPCLSSHDAKAIVHKYVSAFEGNSNLRLLKSTFSPAFEIYDGNTNFLFGSPPGTPYAKGIDNKGKPGALPGILQVIQFPKPVVGMKISVDYLANDCKSVSFRWTARGKYVGAPDSTTPKGTVITYSGLELVLVDPKKKLATKAWTNSDVLPQLYQLGVKVCFQGGKTGCPA